jgi:hypothetical protein
MWYRRKLMTIAFAKGSLLNRRFITDHKYRGWRASILDICYR